MATPTAIPVTVTPEAAERVAELGFQNGVDDLLTQTRRLLPGLRSIQLSLVPSNDMDDIPWLVLECSGGRADREARDALVAWYTWRAENLPMEVGRHFMLNCVEEQETHQG